MCTTSTNAQYMSIFKVRSAVLYKIRALIKSEVSFIINLKAASYYFNFKNIENFLLVPYEQIYFKL